MHYKGIKLDIRFDYPTYKLLIIFFPTEAKNLILSISSKFFDGWVIFVSKYNWGEDWRRGGWAEQQFSQERLGDEGIFYFIHSISS